MLNVIGQLGPLLGTRLYPDSDKPFYVIGMAVCAGFMLGVAGLAALLRVVLVRANKRAAEDGEYVRVGGDEGDGGGTEAGEAVLRNGQGSRRERFVYML